jgi:hypothetical protein
MKTEKFEKQHFVDSLALRFGCEIENPSNESLHLAERSLPEIGRLCLADEEVVVPASDFEMVRTATIFGDVLTDALNKTILSFYADAASTWRRWCNAVNLANLSGERIEVNPVSTPEKVGPGQNFPKSHQEGAKEKVLLAKYGQTFDIPFEVILNDDVNLIQRLLREHTQACVRLENDLCYEVLETPGDIDGKAFFHVDFSNLKTGATLAEDTLNAAMAQLRIMKANNVELRLRPAALLVPPALEKVARKLVVALFNRDADPDRLDVVAESRLDYSTTTWFLAADKNQTDSLVMGFLEGETAPRVDQVRAFGFDGRRYRVKHTAGCKAVRPAGIIKNTT